MPCTATASTTRAEVNQQTTDGIKYTHWGWSLRFPILILIKPFNIYVRVFLAQPTSALPHLSEEHRDNTIEEDTSTYETNDLLGRQATMKKSTMDLWHALLFPELYITGSSSVTQMPFYTLP